MIDLKAAFDACGEDCLHFNEVTDPPTQRPDLCAFLLLDRLVPGQGPQCHIVAVSKHDVIFLDVDVARLAEVATLEDVRTLVRCGVLYNEDVDSLYMFT